ncbi:cation:proton antiporter [Peribacillus frigoritolerans]|nr:cation:proton antiporter [Peribacillus frigoritolerans]
MFVWSFFLVILALLILIGVSNVINHFIPFIPVPLIQIALGVILALLPLGMHVEMETELFLLLFIAPLLFNDGKKCTPNSTVEVESTHFDACTGPRIHNGLGRRIFN